MCDGTEVPEGLRVEKTVKAMLNLREACKAKGYGFSGEDVHFHMALESGTMNLDKGVMRNEMVNTKYELAELPELVEMLRQAWKAVGLTIHTTHFSVVVHL